MNYISIPILQCISGQSSMLLRIYIRSIKQISKDFTMPIGIKTMKLLFLDVKPIRYGGIHPDGQAVGPLMQTMDFA
jgi:hypothetical protein